jgi:hypothetical protein
MSPALARFVAFAFCAALFAIPLMIPNAGA